MLMKFFLYLFIYFINLSQKHQYFRRMFKTTA
jgi:hypothetical protein